MAFQSLSYVRRRKETLRNLGIEQLPAHRTIDIADDTDGLFTGDLLVRTMPVRIIVQALLHQD